MKVCANNYVHQAARLRYTGFHEGRPAACVRAIVQSVTVCAAVGYAMAACTAARPIHPAASIC